MSRQLFALLSAMLLLCPFGFGSFTFGKANVTEVVITQQDDLNGYASEWNYTVNPSSFADEANSVAVDHQRNIIVVGINKSISAGDTSWSIMKFTPDGSLLWTRNYDFSLSEDSPTGVAVDPDGNITVVGYDRVTTSPTDVEWRFLKLAPDGELLWTNSYNFSSGSDMPWDVAMDSQNNTIAVGFDKNTSSSSDFEWRVVKLAPDGTLLWTDSYNFSPGYDVATGVAVDPDDNITVVGIDSNVDREWRIIKITPDGSSLFQNYPLNISPDPDEPSGVAIDHENNTIVVGCDRSRGYYTEQWFIIKYDAVGNQVWNCTVKDVSGVGTSAYPLHDVASDVAVDSSNNITVVGWFRINDTAPSEYNNQWAIMKFGYDGTSLWNYTCHFSPFNDKAKAIAFDSYDDMIVAGFDDASGHNNHQWRIMKFRSLSSNVHNIDTCLNYATIQEAIDAPETLDGHTIFVDAGTYYESVVVDKSVSLIGEMTDDTVIDANGLKLGINVTSNNVSISNLTLTNSSYAAIQVSPNISNTTIQSNRIDSNERYGIHLDHDSILNTIRDNTVENNTGGDGVLELVQSFKNTISGNNITANGGEGIKIDEASENIIEKNTITNNGGTGLYLSDSFSNVVNANTITANYVGLDLINSSTNVLRNNSIADSIYYNFAVQRVMGGSPLQVDLYHALNDVDPSNTVDGKPIYYYVNQQNIAVPADAGCVVLVNCTGIRVLGLTLEKNFNGIRMVSTRDSIISQNTIIGNPGGIQMFHSTNNTLHRNNVSNSSSGFALQVSFDNTMRENNMTNNFISIALHDSSNNRIYHNDFVNSTHPAYSVNSNNSWDDGYPSGGNYWSDYVGADLNGDGIGDSSYTIDANNTDRYPLMGSFSSSSATSRFDVSTISNSTVSPVVFDYLKSTLSLNVTGVTGTKGFCRLEVPRILMQGPYAVIFDGTRVDSTELSAPDSTHAFIYFTYAHSTHQVVIEPEVLYQIQDLLDKYNQLLVDYANLNSSYYELLSNDTLLAGNCVQLIQSYNQLSASYQQHLLDYADLKANYTLHIGNYSNLRNDYNALNQSYSTLQTNYTALSNSHDSLNSTLTDYKQSMQNELGFTRNLVYVFIGITAILLATTAYLAVRKPKTKPETKPET